MKFDLQLFDSGEIRQVHADLMVEIIAQIEKDVVMSGLDIPSVQLTDVDRILVWIHEFILTTERRKPHELKNFLYRTDVDEQLIAQASSHWTNTEMSMVISRLVLLRCLVKVVSRNKHRGA